MVLCDSLRSTSEEGLLVNLLPPEDEISLARELGAGQLVHKETRMEGLHFLLEHFHWPYIILLIIYKRYID